MNVDSAENTSAAFSDQDTVDPEAVRQAIEARAEEIKHRELERAFNRLEAHGSLTSEQRRVVIEFATAIVEGILAAPESSLDEATECDQETVRTAIELFDPNR